MGWSWIRQTASGTKRREQWRLFFAAIYSQRDCFVCVSNFNLVWTKDTGRGWSSSFPGNYRTIEKMEQSLVRWRQSCRYGCEVLFYTFFSFSPIIFLVLSTAIWLWFLLVQCFSLYDYSLFCLWCSGESGSLVDSEHAMDVLVLVYRICLLSLSIPIASLFVFHLSLQLLSITQKKSLDL